jgi:hypothetical protein
MKKYAMLLLVGAFMFSVSAVAQDQTAPEGKKSEVKQAPTPEKRAEKLAKDLSLTDAEKAKVQELYVKQDANLEKFKSEVSKESPDFKKKMKEFRDSQEAELSAVIGTEKFKQLQTIREERKQKMKAMQEAGAKK